MTKTPSKKVLTISLATIFGIAMIVSPIGAEAMGSFLSIAKLKIDMNSDEIKKAEIKTEGKIPSTAESSWYGYVVLTNHGDLLAATTHDGFCDSETQTAACEGTWHIHMVTAAENELCESDDNANGLSIGRLSFEENGELDIKNKKVKFSDASRAHLADFTNPLNAEDDAGFTLGQPDGVVASFEIRPIITGGELQAVCLDVTDALEPSKFKS
ncbi:MAG: hypothetical protein ACE5DT_04250 [Nitrosopumilus sp.]